MKELNGKTKPKEVVKGNSNDFVKKAKVADKKSVFKHIDKKITKKPDVKTENNTIKLTVDKELGVEIVGDTKVRINVVDDFDDYDEEIDDNIEINEDYLNGVN